MIAELVGLDDLGRALIASQRAAERELEPELRQVAGEIEIEDKSSRKG